MVHGNPQKMDSLLGKIRLIWFLPYIKYQYSAILSKSPDLLVTELIFRYKNMLLRLSFADASV